MRQLGVIEAPAPAQVQPLHLPQTYNETETLTGAQAQLQLKAHQLRESNMVRTVTVLSISDGSLSNHTRAGIFARTCEVPHGTDVAAKLQAELLQVPHACRTLQCRSRLWLSHIGVDADEEVLPGTCWCMV